jgi:hypothetical protein
MNILSTPQASLAVGILLMLLGVSFAYKAGFALIKGSVMYWSGFLPLTVISPFFTHLPASKKSLVKRAEGIWVQTVMAPIFFVLAFLCTIAGAEYAGLPAVDTMNLALHGGKAGAQTIAFSKTRGFMFPLLVRSSPVLAKFFNVPLNLDSKQELTPRNNESLQQSINSQSN